MSNTQSTNNFLEVSENKSQYKLFIEKKGILINHGKDPKDPSYLSNNLSSNSSAVKLTEINNNQIGELQVKKKYNIASDIKTVKSAAKIGLNVNPIIRSQADSKELVKPILQEDQNKRNEYLLSEIPTSVYTSTGSCELTLSGLCKAETFSNDTCENTCINSSTIKLTRKATLEKHSLKSERKKNIENPEDLHIFYVGMIQSSKEFLLKFDKD